MTRKYNYYELKVGDKFGRLEVISWRTKVEIDLSGRHCYVIVKCKCLCGKIITTRKIALTRGSTKSCGCLFLEVKRQGTSFAESALKHILTQCKGHAKARGIEWNLADEYAIQLLKSNCYYCGQIPTRNLIHNRQDNDGSKLNLGGIDRIDNNVGYIVTNVVSCCKVCNTMKLHYDINYFISHIKLIYSNLNLDEDYNLIKLIS